MENTTKNIYIYNPAEPKTIAYDYLFNYFGKDVFKGKIITGACVQLAIRAYKDNKEVKFIEEPNYENTYYFSEVYEVSFDRKTLFSIQKSLIADKFFRIAFGWDNIISEVVGYSLDYLDVMTTEIAEIMKDMPDEFKDLPCSTPMEVSEIEFREFLSKHIDEFDISDNVNAQVTSASYI